MYGTYTRLNVWTFASCFDVVRASRTKLTKKCKQDQSSEMRAARKAFYATMLQYHHDAQEMVLQHRL